MQIVPKLGTENVNVPDLIVPYLRDTAEFQLGSYTEGEENWRGIVERHNLKTVILHAPFSQHDVETIVLSPTNFKHIKEYLYRQLEYAESRGIDIHMLFHASMPVESMQQLPIVDRILELLALFDQSPRMALLLENAIVNLSSGCKRILHDPISYILERTPPDQVRVCFDLCHYLASKNVVQEECVFHDDWLPRIYSVHFSETRNGEGYRHFPATHSRGHDSIFGVARDLCVLKELGIDTEKTIIVSEITEEDYQVRFREATDLGWLYALNRDGLSF